MSTVIASVFVFANHITFYGATLSSVVYVGQVGIGMAHFARSLRPKVVRERAGGLYLTVLHSFAEVHLRHHLRGHGRGRRGAGSWCHGVTPAPSSFVNVTICLYSYITPLFSSVKFTIRVMSYYFFIMPSGR